MSSSSVTAATSPFSGQSVSTSGQLHAGLVQPPRSVEAPGFDTVRRVPATSDGGNSRDSWCSTNHQQVPDHAPPQQPQYHLYDWAHHHRHHHTWPQVETNHSTCGRPYPQSPVWHYPENLYPRPAPRAHPYHRPLTNQPPSQVTGIHATQFSLPAQVTYTQYPGAELAGNSEDSKWVGGRERQRVAASHGPLQLTANQLSNTLPHAPCYQWSDPSHTALPRQHQHQRQDAVMNINNSPSILPSDPSFQWFAQPSYRNGVNDRPTATGLYSIND